MSLYNNVYFYLGCNICAYFLSYKLLCHEKDIVGLKKKLYCKLIDKEKGKKKGFVYLSPTSDIHAKKGRLSYRNKA